MIRIVRPAAAPAVLLTRGATESAANCEKYDSAPAEYDSGNLKFEFKSNIYSHATVKQLLQDTQHNKCCYCEAVFGHVYAGAIEHFRPKAAVSQDRTTRRGYPGYYWLAYAWENLLLACERCNTAKSDVFPLSNTADRAHSHHGDVAVERSHLVDPSAQDPRQEIKFRLDAPYGMTLKGKSSIKVLQLDRGALGERRRERLGNIRSIYDSLQVLRSHGGDPGMAALAGVAEKKLRDAIAPCAEYASMSIDWFASVGYVPVQEPDVAP